MWAAYYDELDKMASDMQKEAIFKEIARGAGALARGVKGMLSGAKGMGPAKVMPATKPAGWSISRSELANIPTGTGTAQYLQKAKGMAPLKPAVAKPMTPPGMEPGASLQNKTYAGQGPVPGFPKLKPFKPSFRPAMAMGAA